MKVEKIESIKIEIEEGKSVTLSIEEATQLLLHLQTALNIYPNTSFPIPPLGPAPTSPWIVPPTVTWGTLVSPSAVAFNSQASTPFSLAASQTSQDEEHHE